MPTGHCGHATASDNHTFPLSPSSWRPLLQCTPQRLQRGNHRGLTGNSNNTRVWKEVTDHCIKAKQRGPSRPCHRGDQAYVLGQD